MFEQIEIKIHVSGWSMENYIVVVNLQLLHILSKYRLEIIKYLAHHKVDHILIDTFHTCF